MPAVALPPPVIEAVVADGFAPRIDAPYRYRIEQVRDEAGVPRRYVTDRTIVFRRTPGGLVAELTITAVDGGLATGPGALFERAFAGLRGRMIRYRLSPGGTVTAVEDRAALWQALGDAVLAQAGDDPARLAIARRLVAPLRAMPEPAQVAMLGSMLATVIAADTVRRGVLPDRAVRQDGVPPFGKGAVVTGTERIHAQGGLLIEGNKLEVEFETAGRKRVLDTFVTVD